VHIECEPTHIHRVLQSIGKMTNTNDSERGIARGVALNPGTPVGCIEPLLDQTDVVTLLAINPGWSGQKFIPSTAERIIQARTLIGDRDILLCVDGGITKDNISDTVAMGADMVVTGSAVFDGRTPKENAEYMLAGLGRNK